MNIKQYLPSAFKLDAAQEYVTGKLEEIAANLEKRSFFNFFKKQTSVSGIYLYGGVGRGKTMLMQAFYHRSKYKKKMIHYQDFMQDIHKQMHKFQGNGSIKILANLAKEFASQYNLLCLDEFEIKDITDAMIIGKLFEELKKCNVFIFITSNTKPVNLYKDGLQRASFLPFIDFIGHHFEVLCLENNHDYRLDKLGKLNNRIIYPINAENDIKINKIISHLTNNRTNKDSITVFGREIEFARTHNTILVTNFNELFMRELGYADYVNICHKYTIIILEEVPIIDSNNTDLITRFINFIDNAYFHRVLLFITFYVSPEEIYKEGRRADEFKRTLSRLFEMNSDAYLEGIYD